jgi:hypothetical protein
MLRAFGPYKERVEAVARLRSDRGRVGSASPKLLWSGPRIASQLATVVSGSGSGPSPKRRSLASTSLRPNCPVCGLTERAGNSWSPAGAWWPEEPIVGSAAGTFGSRQVRCIIKQGSAVES